MALSKEDNELLTQTGPDTPCGSFMRRYWQPVALSEELLPEGGAVPVRVMGEDLALFRDAQGHLGLLGRWCSHRGYDLSRGIIEDNGLRCIHAGWLYDATGRCLEQPLEPPDEQFCDEIHHRAYRVEERGGLIFAYMGPDEPPLLPAYEFFSVTDDHRRTTKYFHECNYLQASEANVDPLQVMVLHEIFGEGSGVGPTGGEQEPIVEPEETSFGMRLVSTRKTGDEAAQTEVRSFMLPNLAAVPGAGIDGYAVHWHVPLDDTHHWRFVLAFRRDGPITEDEAKRNGVEAMEGYKIDRERARQSLMDRTAMDDNLVIYSSLLAESQGPIHDRTQEHLGDSDRGIVAMRTLMHKGITDVMEGVDPLGVIRDEAHNDLSGVVVRG
ncbi:MAG: phthalate 4,5-dioxygenase [Chloroflexi bacterium]|nr:phthalate 4,5-dioxygenase [Chloroflexota bacterium]